MSAYDTDTIRQDQRLADVVGQHGVKLKKNGREWLALCPFHSEKTPSFTVFTGRDGVQRFHCHGCSASGDVIDFVAIWHGVSFKEAAKILGGERTAPDTKRTPTPTEPAHDPYDDYKVKYPPDTAQPIVAGRRTPSLLNPKRTDSSGGPATVTYKPSMVFPYRTREGRLIGYVLRVDIDDRKITPAILWMTNSKTGFAGWSHGSLPDPRPPYRVDQLHQNPDLQVIIVEGEKCADIAAEVLPNMVAISWLGGGKALHKTQWNYLKGRSVVLWPDNDPEGEATMLGDYDRQGRWREGLAEIALQAGAKAVKYVERAGDEKPKGWDIWDARKDDGMSKRDILAFARDRAVIVNDTFIANRKAARAPAPTNTAPAGERSPQEPQPAAVSTQQAVTNPLEEPAPAPTPEPERHEVDNVVPLHAGQPVPAITEDMSRWSDNLIRKDKDSDKLEPRSTNNFYWMLRCEESIRGCFAWNEIANCAYVVRPLPWEAQTERYEARPLSSADVYDATMFLERRWLKPTGNQTGEAIERVAQEFSYNPVRDYLDSLTWDGCPRISGGTWEGMIVPPFAQEYFGAPTDEIFTAFVRRWFISAVARIYQPGCMAKSMLVLEGDQNAGKSTFFRLLGTVGGRDYFADQIGDISNPRAALQLHGVWIVEVSELSDFSRKEVGTIKAWASRVVDRYVPPYGKTARQEPRKFVVAGTVNPSGQGYLRDSTGNVRFWPVPVRRQIDLDRIEEERDQIWAEAVALYRSGEQWHLTPDEEKVAAEIADDRHEEDPWQYSIDPYLDNAIGRVTIKEIIRDLNIPSSQQSALTVKRITDHLNRRGWVRANKRGEWRRGEELDNGDRDDE